MRMRPAPPRRQESTRAIHGAHADATKSHDSRGHPAATEDGSVGPAEGGSVGPAQKLVEEEPPQEEQPPEEMGAASQRRSPPAAELPELPRASARRP